MNSEIEQNLRTLKIYQALQVSLPQLGCQVNLLIAQETALFEMYELVERKYKECLDFFDKTICDWSESYNGQREYLRSYIGGWILQIQEAEVNIRGIYNTWLDTKQLTYEDVNSDYYYMVTLLDSIAVKDLSISTKVSRMRMGVYLDSSSGESESETEFESFNVGYE